MGQPSSEFGGRSLAVVASWVAPGDVALRVVRWTLRGDERALYRWARGLDFDQARGQWVAGVALERRDGPRGRWQTLARHEIEGHGRTLPESRLHGWELGLVARGAKLAARLGAASTQPPNEGPGPRPSPDTPGGW
jgi:hypothetical protein